MSMDSPDGMSGVDGWFAPRVWQTGGNARDNAGQTNTWDEPEPAQPAQSWEPEPWEAENQAPAEAETPAEEETQDQAPDPLAESDLSYLLQTALTVLRAEAVTGLVDAGYDELTPVQAEAFEVLRERGGLTGEDLSGALELPGPEAVKLAKGLEQQGYVRRTPGPRGPRHPIYVLTSKAQQHLRAAGYVHARLQDRLVDRLGSEEMADLRIRLARLIRVQAGDDLPPARPSW